MNILHINTYDFGGAATAAIRLHKALLKSEISSSVLFLTKRVENIPHSYYFERDSNRHCTFINSKFKQIKRELFKYRSNNYLNSRKLRNKSEEFEIFSFSTSDYDITTQKIYQSADIIHLHWVSGFIDYRFFQMNKKPVIWTLHDMSPFTGGCHFSFGCEKYVTECKNCPQLRGTINPDNSYIDQENKKSFLKGISPIITAPSKWLYEESIKSKLFSSFENFHIPYSIDIGIFKPHNKNFCRSILNIDIDRKVLLFVSDEINNRRKGFDLLIDALSKVRFSNLLVCAVGSGDTKIDYPIEIVFLGKISDERLMSVIFSAADAFILPSREDNLPNVLLESLCCGTPVISFPVGGMIDCIENGINGILTSNQSSEDLADAITDFVLGKYYFNSESISRTAIQRFSPALQAGRYINIYKKLLKLN